MTHHNKDILNYIDGFSVHWYWDFLIGDKVIKDVRKNYPEKFILYTEASMGMIITKGLRVQRSLKTKTIRQEFSKKES